MNQFIKFLWLSLLVFLSNQTAGFFYHHFIWKESINILYFLHGVGNQGKIVSETTTLVGCGQMGLLSNKIAGFFDHQYLWKESINILRVCIAIIIKGTISGRNQLISLLRLLNLTGFRLVITCSLAKLKVVIAAAGSNLINLIKLMQWMNWIKSIKNSFQNKNNGHSTYFRKESKIKGDYTMILLFTRWNSEHFKEHLKNKGKSILIVTSLGFSWKNFKADFICLYQTSSLLVYFQQGVTLEISTFLCLHFFEYLVLNLLSQALFTSFFLTP